MSETKESIKQFISTIAAKEYSQANGFLQKTIENKLKERVRTALSPKK